MVHPRLFQVLLQIAVLVTLVTSLGAWSCNHPTTPAVCGDGVLDETEACDPGLGAVACDALGSAWGAGPTASCRSDCSGYNVDDCQSALGANGWEVVMPGAPEPTTKPTPGVAKAARCNDGSAFGFYVHLSDAATPSKDWILYLEGGGYCDDKTTLCKQRDPDLVTTISDLQGTTLKAVVDGDTSHVPDRSGLLSNDDPNSGTGVNPTFADANKAFAHYCSSDFWSGQVGGPLSLTTVSNWWFSGYANVQAMVRTLQLRYGLNDSDPDTRVLLAGGSAGATGVLVNAGHVASLLPNVSKAGRMRVASDGGYYPVDWMVGTLTNTDVLKDAAGIWKSHLDHGCWAANQANGTESRCFFGPVAAESIRVGDAAAPPLPVLVVGREFDTTLAGKQGVKDIGDPVDAARAADWTNTVRGYADQTGLYPLSDTVWSYMRCNPTQQEVCDLQLGKAGTTPFHVMSHKDDWGATPIPNIDDAQDTASLRDVYTAFWNASAIAPSVHYVESACPTYSTSFACK